MRNIVKSTRKLGWALMVGCFLLTACSKDETAALNLTVPTPSFSSSALTPSDEDPNNLELINTSSHAMSAYWTVLDDAGNTLGTFTGDTVRMAVIYQGTYTVKMAAGGPGGLSDTITQAVTVDKDNFYAVGPSTLLGILTGRGLGKSSRTWKADRVVNTVIVWDNYANCLAQINGGSGAWWAFGPGEIATDGTGRDGYFDDTYTFNLGKNAKMDYDDHNSVYLDNGGSGWTAALPAPWNTKQATVSASDLYSAVPQLKPWGSGSFGYTVAAPPAGEMNLGTITISGKGGHLGLQDKINGAEAVTPTASAVTYDVLAVKTDQVDPDGVHYDMLAIGVHYDAAGDVFTFMLRSDR